MCSALLKDKTSISNLEFPSQLLENLDKTTTIDIDLDKIFGLFER
jgi:hypothetical protein